MAIFQAAPAAHYLFDPGICVIGVGQLLQYTKKLQMCQTRQAGDSQPCTAAPLRIGVTTALPCCVLASLAQSSKAGLPSARRHAGEYSIACGCFQT